MKLVIVSGRSGSGKSTALHQLEDLGYYCVDNLPVALLPELVATFRADHADTVQGLAVGIDARNRPNDLARYNDIANTLAKTNTNPQIVYLDARDDVLLARFSSTRRRHPLTSDSRSLEEAIAYERELLDPLSAHAVLKLDTTALTVHELRESLRQRFTDPGSTQRIVLLESFGFKHGVPLDTDMVFDVRCLPNPHWEMPLRHLSGLDQPVINYLQGHPLVESLFSDIEAFLTKWLPELQANDRNYVTVAIGCTGGQHRSVYMVERMSQVLTATLGKLQVRHRELHRQGSL
ncbi:MAG: RNase adapter RapZ [Paraperlucidibaca sp.]